MFGAVVASCDSYDDKAFNKDDLVGIWERIHEEGWDISGERRKLGLKIMNSNIVFDFNYQIDIIRPLMVLF